MECNVSWSEITGPSSWKWTMGSVMRVEAMLGPTVAPAGVTSSVITDMPPQIVCCPKIPVRRRYRFLCLRALSPIPAPHPVSLGQHTARIIRLSCVPTSTTISIWRNPDKCRIRQISREIRHACDARAPIIQPGTFCKATPNLCCRSYSTLCSSRSSTFMLIYTVSFSKLAI